MHPLHAPAFGHELPAYMSQKTSAARLLPSNAVIHTGSKRYKTAPGLCRVCPRSVPKYMHFLLIVLCRRVAWTRTTPPDISRTRAHSHQSFMPRVRMASQEGLELWRSLKAWGQNKML